MATLVITIWLIPLNPIKPPSKAFKPPCSYGFPINHLFITTVFQRVTAEILQGPQGPQGPQASFSKAPPITPHWDLTNSRRRPKRWPGGVVRVYKTLRVFFKTTFRNTFIYFRVEKNHLSLDELKIPLHTPSPSNPNDLGIRSYTSWSGQGYA